MKFNKELSKEKLPKNLDKKEGGLGALLFYRENTVIHNHYELGWEFTQTEFFKEIQSSLDFKNITTWEGARPRFLELRDEQVKIHKSIFSKDSIDEKDVYKLLTNLAYHICVENPQEPDVIRFRLDSWEDKESTLTALEESFEILNTIEKYQDDPETNGFKYKYWNKLTADIWSCTQGGLYEEGLYMIKTLRNLIFKIHHYHQEHGVKPKNCVFTNVLDQETPGRFLKTLWMAEAKIYEGMGNIEKSVECYSEIGKLHHSENIPSIHPEKIAIWWFTGQTRVIEALIQVYKQTPTIELKSKILARYIDSCNFDSYEPTESVRERGFITYMLAKYVLNIKFK